MMPPETEAWMADRIRPKKTVSLQAGHASLASQPGDVAALIAEDAASLA